MKTPATKEPPQTLVPAVHLEFIQNQVGLSEGNGADAIEAYHRALFLHQHAAAMERFQQQERIHEDRLAHLDTRLKDAQGKLAGLDKLIPVNLEGEPDVRPTQPWNSWDRLMFAAALLGVLGLLVFGVLNISFNLLESGLVTFVENPVRAYFWAALLPVGALAVKVGWDCLQSQRKREIYLWTSLIAGVGGVLVWVGAYATVYPTLSKTTNEHLESLSVFDQGAGQGAAKRSLTASGAKWVDAITVASQAVAEIFISAVLGIYLTMIYSRHRPVRLAPNPLFMQLDEERRLLEESVERERLALAEAKGNAVRLQNELAALVAFAKSMFQKDAALRRDQSHQKQLLLDQITEQLRSQLQRFGNDGEADRGQLADARALGLETGK
jgi:hypothetical protein